MAIGAVDMGTVFDAEYLSHWPDFLYWCGAAVALLFVLFVFAVRKRPRTSPTYPEPNRTPQVPPTEQFRERSDYWEALSPAADDRRRQLRRDGNPTLVFLLGRDGGPPQRGCVVDRNSGGLRLVVAQPASPGTVFRVQSCNAPTGTPWVDVVVRRCMEADGRYELGCEFMANYPWGVLLTFG